MQQPIKQQDRKNKIYKPAIIGFMSIVLAIVVAMGAALGSRTGWWNYNFAVIILKWAAYTGIAGSVLCLLGLVMTRPGKNQRGFIVSLLGVAIVIPMIVFLQFWREAKQTSPPISDITTNPASPPSFWLAPNSRTYGGFETETFQNEFYPDIKPLIITLPAETVFELVLNVIKDQEWRLYEPDKSELHIEATATTFWFGFNDDVVIHITREGKNKSRVDVRSASRFSGGDGGTNARRIRKFFSALHKEVDKINHND